MLNLLVFVAVFALLILAHELGHLITAKRAGVQVLEFGFGFPPRLFAFRKGETEYSINLLPLGGFVRMMGEEDPSHPRSLASRGVGARLLILSAGGLMNLALAFGLFTFSFMIPQETVVGQVQVVEVAPGSPAELAGVRPGNVILKVNDRPIQNLSELAYNVHLNLGKETTLVLREAPNLAATRLVTLVPRWNPPPGQGAMGVRISMANAYPREQAYPLWEAVPLGLRKGLDIITLIKNDIQTMLARRAAPAVAGPIGIYQIAGEVARFGLGPVVDFAAILSINLAFINLLPIPMLDGGRMAFVVLEGIRRGKRISPERESLVHFMGLMFLLSLILLVSYYDIQRLLAGQGPLP
jgi:regulator of sigma E protease